jgi:hypothetical protein
LTPRGTDGSPAVEWEALLTYARSSPVRHQEIRKKTRPLIHGGGIKASSAIPSSR